MVRSKSWNRSWLSRSERRIERPALLIDEVDRGQLGGDLLAQPVDRLEVGEVAREDVRGAAAHLDDRPGLLELVLAARHQHRDAAGLGDLERGDLADARGRTGDEHVLAGQRRADPRVVAGGLVEVLLPVAPQRAGVALEVGHGDARAGQGLLGAGGVEDGGEAGVGDAPRPGCRRRPSVWSSSDLAPGRSLTRPVSRLAGRSAPGHGQPRARRGELRCPGGLAEQVDHLDGRLRLGVDQVEGLAVVAGQVGEVVHRLGDVVDGHDVGLAQVDADQRQPRRQPVAQHLHDREEVVGPVDLVHRAGLRVADDDRRPVDPPRHGALARARSARTRTWCGGRARAGAGPRRTSSRRSGPGTRPRPPPTTPGGSSRPPARRPARRRCGCRRRSSPRWSRRRRSCRRSRRGGRSGRSRRGAPRPTPRRRPSPGSPRSPTTGTTRSEPQRRIRVSSRPIEPARQARRSRPRGGRRAPGRGVDR